MLCSFGYPLGVEFVLFILYQIILYYSRPLSFLAFISYIILILTFFLSFVVLVLYPRCALSLSSFILLILHHKHPLSSLSFIILYHHYHLSPLNTSSSFLILIFHHPYPLSSSNSSSYSFSSSSSASSSTSSSCSSPHHHQHQARCAGRPEPFPLAFSGGPGRRTTTRPPGKSLMLGQFQPRPSQDAKKILENENSRNFLQNGFNKKWNFQDVPGLS